MGFTPFITSFFRRLCCTLAAIGSGNHVLSALALSPVKNIPPGGGSFLRCDIMEPTIIKIISSFCLSVLRFPLRLSFCRAGAERGAVMVQMAIISPLMILLVGGTIDYGILLKEQGIITEATRVGARKAAGLISPTPEWVCIMSTDITREYLNNASINGSEFTVAVDRLDLDPVPPAGSPPQCPLHTVFSGGLCFSVGVRVTVSRPPKFYILPWHATLSSASTTFIQEDGIGPSNPCFG